MGRRHLVLVCLWSTTLVLAPATSHAAVPREFFGVYSEDSLGRSGAVSDRIVAQQVEAGVGTIRVPFDWQRIEPIEGYYDFAMYDAFVGTAARAGMSVLPTLIGTPWFYSSAPSRGARRGLY